MLSEFAIIWVFAVFGLSMILSISHVGLWLQRFWLVTNPINKLLRCPMCNAFWIGILFSLFWQPMTGVWLIDGLVASGTTLLLYCICWKLAIKNKHF